MSVEPKTITIYSVGLLGGSIGAALKTSGFTGRIIGLSSPAAIAKALELGCIDEGYSYSALPDVIGRTDYLLLCSPVYTIMETLKTLGSLQLPDGLIVSDVGSTKGEITACAQQALPDSVYFIGGHPMAGSEKSGVGASDPYLFENAVYILSPENNVPQDVTAGFAKVLEQYLGCRTLTLDAAAHDRIVAAVSHVPHVLAVALVELAARQETALPGTLRLAAGGFKDMTRIAAAPYSMWHDILMTNQQAVHDLIDTYIGILTEMKSDLAQGSLKKAFDDAAEVRRDIPMRNKGIITATADIVVMAKDRPGSILGIAQVLAQENLNVKDIEVLKVREGEAGSIRLSFNSKATAQKAVAVLTASGFTARERE
jgi:prephenate dehydrogenase